MQASEKPSILIVDDISTNLILLEHIIQPLGVNIISAQSGQEALQKTNGKELFLALLDIKMPGMDGIELAEKLQQDTARSIVPVIFLTAYADSELLEKSYQVGGVDFISKPFKRSILLSKVKIFLELFNQKQLIHDNHLQLEKAASDLDLINKSLQKSWEQYRLMIELSPEAVIIQAEDKILFTNQAALDLFKTDSNHILSISILDVIRHEDRTSLKRTIKQVINEKKSSGYFETTLLNFNKETIDVEVICFRLTFDDQQAVQFIIRDISSRKREEKIQKIVYEISNATNTGISLEDLILVIRKELGTLIDTTNFFLARYDQEMQGLQPYYVSEFDSSSMDVLKGLAEYVLNTQKTLLATKENISQILKSDLVSKAEWLPNAWMGTPLLVQGNVIGIFAVHSENYIYETRDVSVFEFVAQQVSTCIEKKNAEIELEKSHDALTKLTRHLEEVREDERKRIALDLHDDLGQKLTALLMDISWLNRNLDPEKQQLLAKLLSMKELLNETINTVRRISIGLRPSGLDDLGLIPALQMHFNDFENNTGIKVISEIAHDDLEDLELDPKLSVLIFRVVQEALTNVVRHASASEVRFEINKTNEKIVVEISDNGIGISSDKIKNPKTFGLLGMRERINSWGGRLHIKGQPGIGTRLLIQLPLNN